MEIERKYLLPPTDFPLADYSSVEIEQSYVSADPVIRLRRVGDEYILTVKGEGMVMRREFELSLTAEQYTRLRSKTEGRTIRKTRYFVPLDGGKVAEADVYHGELSWLMTVEVEFASKEEMQAFVPPAWFGRDVSEEGAYKNSALGSLHN